jgi:hypothetical protein
MALTKVNAANIIEGILPVANGGTGATSLSGANLAVTNAANTFTTDQSISGLTVGKGAGSVSGNTVVGASALATNSTGSGLCAVGSESLYNNTGSYNTAVGYGRVLYANTTGSSNAAVGGNDATANGTMRFNTTGSYNAAFGIGALGSNTTAAGNTAVGYQSLYTNSTGGTSTAIGYKAGYSNTADNNSFISAYAGYSVTSGTQNTIVGRTAGYSTTTGSFNTFVGDNAGYYVTTGGKNSILGAYNGNQSSLDIRTASNYIVLSDGDGNPRIWVNNSNVVYAPGIYANTSANSANVVAYGAGGDLYRSTSALKYKQDVRDLPSIDINKFRAVVYKSKCAKDDQTIDHFGIIADEVDAAGIKELVNYGDDDQVENFKYDRLTVVLLKAIQELKAEFDAYKAEHP